MTNHNEIENILQDQNKSTPPIGKPTKELGYNPDDIEISNRPYDSGVYTQVKQEKIVLQKDPLPKNLGYDPEGTESSNRIYDPGFYTQTSSVPNPVIGGDILPAESNPNAWEKIFASPILWVSLILFLSVFLLIILSELFQFIQSVQSAPFFLQIPAYICIFILFSALSWSFIKLGVAYRKLRRSPQVRLDQIRNDLNREIIRNQIEKNIFEGFTALQMIVRDYPIQDKKQIDLLQKSGMTPHGISTFKDNITFLLKEGNLGKEKWIEDCDRLFVQVIDKCAKSLVKTYALQVALKTAIIPYGFLDAFTVAVNSVYMVEDLCRLYFVRGGKWQSFILALKVLFSVFIAAKLEDQIDNATEALGSSFLESCKASAGEIFSKLLSGVFNRAAEGAVNGVIFYRLGLATISMLRPIKLK